MSKAIRGGENKQFKFPEGWLRITPRYIRHNSTTPINVKAIYVDLPTMCIHLIRVENKGQIGHEVIAGPFISVKALTVAYKLHARLRG